MPQPILVGEVGAMSIGDTYIPELGNGGYDVAEYDIRVTIDPKVSEIAQALVLIHAVATTDNLARFSLDFIGFEIDELLVNQVPVYYERLPRKLIITLEQPLSLGENFTIDIEYHGAPVFEPSPYVPFSDHVGLLFRNDLGRMFVVSEPDGARYWFPCNDHPIDKALFRFEVTVPENLVGIANGRLVDTFTELPNAFPDGRAGDRYVWQADFMMATYLATVVVGDYVRVEGVSPQGVPLRSYVFANQRSEMEALTPLIGEAVDWFSELLGPYPFDEFGYVTVNGFSGALETQTMVVTGTLNEEVLIHELAHMWFGNWVSLDSWGDMWRNEGFATYLAALWMTRDDPGEMESQVRRWRLMLGPDPVYPLNDPEPGRLFSLTSYYGGALLVDDLRLTMEDEAFYRGLNSYLERFGGSVASPEDFQAEMELASGIDLDSFFAQWLR